MAVATAICIESMRRKVEPIWMAGGGLRVMKGLMQTLIEADA